MSYMENHFDKRLDPRLLVDGARSVITLTYSYFQIVEREKDVPKISMYALGEDYHFVLKDKMHELAMRLQELLGPFNYRVFVDSAPVLDKAWAKRSGAGWMGKNSNIISREAGSFFFVGEIVCDLELENDAPIEDYCGTCTACIDACPTQAIIQPYVVDGSKCISYFTIELKESDIPKSYKGKMEDWMFGCDVCQDVCPWNRFAKQNHEPRFKPLKGLLAMNATDWKDLTQEEFRERFDRSPLSRPGLEGIQRNVKFLTE